MSVCAFSLSLSSSFLTVLLITQQEEYPVINKKIDQNYSPKYAPIPSVAICYTWEKLISPSSMLVYVLFWRIMDFKLWFCYPFLPSQNVATNYLLNMIWIKSKCVSTKLWPGGSQCGSKHKAPALCGSAGPAESDCWTDGTFSAAWIGEITNTTDCYIPQSNT